MAKRRKVRRVKPRRAKRKASRRAAPKRSSVERAGKAMIDIGNTTVRLAQKFEALGAELARLKRAIKFKRSKRKKRR